MSIVKLLVGVPGSGKTTMAHNLHKEGWVAVERDQIRWDQFGKWYGVDESLVTKIQLRKLETLIKNGFNVVVSDTNINPDTRSHITKFCEERGAEVVIDHVAPDMLFNELQKRNNSIDRRAIGKVVPLNVMNSFYAAYREQFPIMASKNSGGKPAFVFDIDGTLAEMQGRSPFEWARVAEDRPHRDVIEMTQNLNNLGFDIIVMSGRDAVCREETLAWLEAYEVEFDELFMRPAGSHLKDSAVKHDLYHEHVDRRWNVHGVFDDRQQVVDAWRKMGLRCYQVQEGNF